MPSLSLSPLWFSLSINRSRLRWYGYVECNAWCRLALKAKYEDRDWVNPAVETSKKDLAGLRQGGYGEFWSVLWGYAQDRDHCRIKMKGKLADPGLPEKWPLNGGYVFQTHLCVCVCVCLASAILCIRSAQSVASRIARKHKSFTTGIKIRQVYQWKKLRKKLKQAKVYNRVDTRSRILYHKLAQVSGTSSGYKIIECVSPL